jgi:hypothetical protein
MCLGLKKNLPRTAPLAAGSPWSLYCWIRTEEALTGRTLIAGIGDLASTSQRYFAAIDGKLAFWAGGENILASPKRLDPNTWHLLVVTFDGKTVTLYADGSQLTQNPLAIGETGPVMQMAPEELPWPNSVHFAGKIADFTLTSAVLTSGGIADLRNGQAPIFDRVEFELGSKNWPVQTRAQAGYRTPQDPATLPKSSAPVSRLAAKPPYTGPALVARESNQWAIAGGWRLSSALDVTADPAQVSQAGFQMNRSYDATVPGTVLTTLIDRGIYPDPDYGLNNLAIPETLNKNDYWYRTEFTPPASTNGRRLTLTFHGINYAASVWLNGKRLGNIRGAFIRGVFDVTGALLLGKPNALAVRISPPPHPGIPQEQSAKGGPGENGGLMCLDGPTFIDTEGWDWIPGIRDRNIGIWQEVTLSATDAVKLGDPQVITTLPLPDTSHAEVIITVPLRNESGSPAQGVLHAGFEGVEITKNVTLSPGETTVTLAPAEFSQLRVSNPRLWWPTFNYPQIVHRV